ncbi:hypothetical protein [Flavilitoribacter nigricans]|uniref:Effector-associated domain-containing protein n=1 Tax=Flavilitoribacter nigricans (strain ATCC 23147 / DSM 23189 / NBRC 102662 / NCIMB 1420 / SS-2) TaxID=1122177 RepID=A0A2D0N488_FLAN2|nr:hypothetical protein [Flavilitoribacter nigricans]PHN02583.1 hypothetical protein CRP01_31910 [Flavilitoribacter nigricans DSM 23189 = NBRC 102662]
MKEIRNNFKALLKKNLKKAILEIQSSLHYESSFYDDLIMFYSQVSRLDRDNHIQVISYEEYNLGINKIQKGVLAIINDLEVEDLKIKEPSIEIKSESEKKMVSEEEEFELLRYGEFKSRNGKFKLTIAPTVLFSYRIAQAFPGVRGLRWFEGNVALKRLSLLLQEPTQFDIANGYGLYSDPIWWFRGNSGLPIERFKVLSHGKFLLNSKELKISKIAVYTSTSYYRCFVYVETKADQPIGLYDDSNDDDQIKRIADRWGYFYERYGLYNEIPIRGDEFDDGAAEINGEIVNTQGAELRMRFLTSYNFIIVAKSSPFNSREGYKLGEKYMNKILKGDESVEDFAKEAELLDKNWMDK